MRRKPSTDPQALDRRDFLRLGGAAGAGFLMGGLAPSAGAASPPLPADPVTPEAMPTRCCSRSTPRIRTT